MAQGIIRRIGDGTSTGICTHNWIPRDNFKRPITSLVPNPPHLVAQLIDNTNASWNENLIRTVFTHFDAEEILKIPLCTRTVSDFWAWHEESKGIFTVRSVYRMILRTKLSRENWIEEEADTSVNQSESNQWSSTWHIKVPSKLRVFIWRLARQSIPCNVLLHHRNMATTETCALCGARDTWRHALLSYPMAGSVWVLAPDHILEIMSGHMEDSAKDWIFALHKIMAQDDFVRMVVTLWAIWGVRRKAIHENIFQAPATVHGFINSYIMELREINVKSTPAAVSTTPQTRSLWIPPAPGYSKFNSDAAVSRHGFGSIGVIARDQGGTFLGASALVFRFISDPPTLEALAIREAMALAKDRSPSLMSRFRSHSIWPHVSSRNQIRSPRPWLP